MAPHTNPATAWAATTRQGETCGMDALKACASSRDSVLKGGSVASSVSLAMPRAVVDRVGHGARVTSACSKASELYGVTRSVRPTPSCAGSCGCCARMFGRLPYITLLAGTFMAGAGSLNGLARFGREPRQSALAPLSCHLLMRLLRSLLAILPLALALPSLAAALGGGHHRPGARRTGGARTTGRRRRSADLAGAGHRPPAALAHLLEEPGRLGPADHAAVDTARGRESRRDRMAHAAGGCRSARW